MMTRTKTLEIKGGLCRFEPGAVRADSLDADDRTVEISFSSEAPVKRYFGTEILGHKKSEVDLSRVTAGVMPLLVNHDPDRQVGKIEKAWIEDGKARALVRFSGSPAGLEVFNDVQDGIRSAVSVGYSIEKVRQVDGAPDDDTGVYRATRWMPMEISFVSIPADPTVGVGRDLAAGEPYSVPVEAIEAEPQSERTQAMPVEETKPANAAEPPAAVRASDPAPVNTDVAINAALEKRNKEIAEITDLGVAHNRRDLADKAIKDGVDIGRFRGLMLDALAAGTALQAPASEIGATIKDVRDFSLLRAIRAAASKDWSDAGLEREMIKAAEDKIRKSHDGRVARGFFVPYEVLTSGHRALTDTATSGQELIGTDHHPESFIGILYGRMMIRRLGARVLSGLVGDVSIPKMSAGSTAYWVADAGTTTGSTPTTGSLNLTPKTVSARVDISRRLAIQSSPSAEQLVREDLAMRAALEIDDVAIEGGGSNEPTGITQTSGIGDVAIASDGGAITWAHVIELETDVATANADIENLAYLTTPGLRGKLKQVDKGTDTGKFVWGEDGRVNGYDAFASTQVPSDLTKGAGTNLHAMIFGNFHDLVMAEWGMIDIKAEDITLADSGGISIRMFADVDIGIRNAASFSACLDANPSA